MVFCFLFLTAGFGQQCCSEVLVGALPTEQNTPQKCVDRFFVTCTIESTYQLINGFLENIFLIVSYAIQVFVWPDCRAAEWYCVYPSTCQKSAKVLVCENLVLQYIQDIVKFLLMFSSDILNSWLYRVRPSAMHGPLREVSAGLIRADFGGEKIDPNQFRWNPFPMPAADKKVDFVQGMATMMGAGSAEGKNGLAIHIYTYAWFLRMAKCELILVY